MMVGKIAKVQDFLVTANEDGEPDINSRIVCRIIEEARRIRPGQAGAEVHEPISAEIIRRWNLYGDFQEVAIAAEDFVRNIRDSSGTEIRRTRLVKALAAVQGNI